MNSTHLTSVAVRVCHMDAMAAFYSEAFQIQFEDVDTFGLPSKFGNLNGTTLKLVPLREEAEVDFDNYPIHQLGFRVPDLQRVIDIALKYGGKVEGNVIRRNGALSAAVRDPDGNSLELSSEPA